MYFKISSILYHVFYIICAAWLGGLPASACGLRSADGRAKKARKARRGRMKSRVKSLAALVILGGSAIATIAPAHHAMVMYDRTRVQTLTGTVVELQWTNLSKSMKSACAAAIA
jgi:hypothetical protein